MALQRGARMLLGKARVRRLQAATRNVLPTRWGMLALRLRCKVGRRVGGWFEGQDTATGAFVYFNPRLRASRWDPPPELHLPCEWPTCAARSRHFPSRPALARHCTERHRWRCDVCGEKGPFSGDPHCVLCSSRCEAYDAAVKEAGHNKLRMLRRRREARMQMLLRREALAARRQRDQETRAALERALATAKRRDMPEGKAMRWATQEVRRQQAARPTEWQDLGFRDYSDLAESNPPETALALALGRVRSQAEDDGTAPREVDVGAALRLLSSNDARKRAKERAKEASAAEGGEDEDEEAQAAAEQARWRAEQARAEFARHASQPRMEAVDVSVALAGPRRHAQRQYSRTASSMELFGAGRESPGPDALLQLDAIPVEEEGEEEAEGREGPANVEDQRQSALEALLAQLSDSEGSDSAGGEGSSAGDEEMAENKGNEEEEEDDDDEGEEKEEVAHGVRRLALGRNTLSLPALGTPGVREAGEVLPVSQQPGSGKTPVDRKVLQKAIRHAEKRGRRRRSGAAEGREEGRTSLGRRAPMAARLRQFNMARFRGNLQSKVGRWVEEREAEAEAARERERERERDQQRRVAVKGEAGSDDSASSSASTSFASAASSVSLRAKARGGARGRGEARKAPPSRSRAGFGSRVARRQQRVLRRVARSREWVRQGVGAQWSGPGFEPAPPLADPPEPAHGGIEDMTASVSAAAAPGEATKGRGPRAAPGLRASLLTRTASMRPMLAREGQEGASQPSAVAAARPQGARHSGFQAEMARLRRRVGLGGSETSASAANAGAVAAYRRTCPMLRWARELQRPPEWCPPFRRTRSVPATAQLHVGPFASMALYACWHGASVFASRAQRAAAASAALTRLAAAAEKGRGETPGTRATAAAVLSASGFATAQEAVEAAWTVAEQFTQRHVRGTLAAVGLVSRARSPFEPHPLLQEKRPWWEEGAGDDEAGTAANGAQPADRRACTAPAASRPPSLPPTAEWAAPVVDAVAPAARVWAPAKAARPAEGLRPKQGRVGREDVEPDPSSPGQLAESRPLPYRLAHAARRRPGEALPGKLRQYPKLLYPMRSGYGRLFVRRYNGRAVAEEGEEGEDSDGAENALQSAGRARRGAPRGEDAEDVVRNHARSLHSSPAQPRRLRGQIAVYTGTLKEGRPHGVGRWEGKGGDLYVGHFWEGRREGEGVLYKPDGRVYRGARPPSAQVRLHFPALTPHRLVEAGVPPRARHARASRRVVVQGGRLRRSPPSPLTGQLPLSPGRVFGGRDGGPWHADAVREGRGAGGAGAGGGKARGQAPCRSCRPHCVRC